MGYLSIPNLYRPEAQQILQFKQLYALEKIHGTSAHISWKEGQVRFFSGGESYSNFAALFDEAKLAQLFTEKIGHRSVVIYGEAYGGKQQKMSETYGHDLRFVVFDVKIDDCWLNVDSAARFVASMDLEFVDYALIPGNLEAVDQERDRPSAQAVRNGITEARLREGIVLRPPFEVTLNNGERLIAKHKRDEFRETGRPIPVVSGVKAEANLRASQIAEEWCTQMRFEHIKDHLLRERDVKQIDMTDIPLLIQLMTEDIKNESAGLVVISDEKALGKAVGSRVVKMVKTDVATQLVSNCQA